MNYSQTLDFLFGQLPMYQRIGAAAYKADLNNAIELCRILGNPESAFKSIHIAGTNGKGSVSHMLASVLQESGYRTGLYTSPHLKDFRERIRINGEMIPEEKVVTFVSNHTEDLKHIQPSFFEYTFGMAMSYFAEEKVDFAVIETGMGGRLDSTNVVNPLLSVITNIGLDHTRFLGDTLEEIAMEKAGIIKRGVPVVIGQSQMETELVFRKVCKEKSAPVVIADQQYFSEIEQHDDLARSGFILNVKKNKQHRFRQLETPFRVRYQLKNTVTAIASLDKLIELGFNISENSIRQGILQVDKNTGFAGRWHVLGKQPLIVCDAGHNLDGIREVVGQIAGVKYNALHIVLGVVDDKSLDDILALLPPRATYYFCKANIPRGLDQERLKNIASGFSLYGASYPSVLMAYKQAVSQAGDDDMVFIGGSTFVVAEVL